MGAQERALEEARKGRQDAGRSPAERRQDRIQDQQAGAQPDAPVAGTGTAIVPKPDRPRDRPKLGDVVGADYVVSQDLARVAQALTKRFDARFGHLTGQRLQYMLKAGEPRTTGKCSSIGRAVVVPSLYGELTGLDGIVVVNGEWFRRAPAIARDGFVFHVLSHYLTDDQSGRLVTVGHDAELFVAEARHFGAWREEIGQVASQLEIFERKGADVPAKPVTLPAPPASPSSAAQPNA